MKYESLNKRLWKNSLTIYKKQSSQQKMKQILNLGFGLNKTYTHTKKKKI